MMENFFGILGAILLGGCGLPQAIKTIRSGEAEDISWIFLAMWSIGELCMILYLFFKDTLDVLLLANYLINMVFLMPIIFIKWKNDIS